VPPTIRPAVARGEPPGPIMIDIGGLTEPQLRRAHRQALNEDPDRVLDRFLHQTRDSKEPAPHRTARHPNPTHLPRRGETDRRRAVHRRPPTDPVQATRPRRTPHRGAIGTRGSRRTPTPKETATHRRDGLPAVTHRPGDRVLSDQWPAPPTHRALTIDQLRGLVAASWPTGDSGSVPSLARRASRRRTGRRDTSVAVAVPVCEGGASEPA
jgi:hypothetical protein